MSKSSTKDLKNRVALFKAVIYVASGIILIIIGYNIALWVFQKVNSLSELIGKNVFSVGGFAFSLLLSAYGLKKTEAEISLRESQETNN